MLGKDGLQGTGATRSLDVSNNTDDNNWRGFDDGNGLNDFLLVDLGSWLVDITDDVGHAGLVAQEGGKVDWLAGVILGESLALTTETTGTFLGGKTHRTVTGSGEFPMGHVEPYNNVQT